jgi:hypothetical protein
MTPRLSAEAFVFHPADNLLWAFDFTQFGLGADEVISSVDVVATPGGLSFSEEGPNAAEIKNAKGGPVAIGKAAQFRMTGGTATVDYALTVTVVTDAGNTINGPVTGKCRSK